MITSVPKIPYTLKEISALDTNFISEERYLELVEIAKKLILPYIPMNSWKLYQDISSDFIDHIHIYTQFFSNDEEKLSLQYIVNPIVKTSPLFICKERRLDMKPKISRVPELKISLDTLRNMQGKDLSSNPSYANTLCRSVLSYITMKRWNIEVIDFEKHTVSMNTICCDNLRKEFTLNFTVSENPTGMKSYINIFTKEEIRRSHEANKIE